MTIAGLGVLALLAGTAGGIAAYTSKDERVVTAVGQPGAAVDPPAAEVSVQPPTGLTGLGAGSTGHAQAEQDADKIRSAPGVADRTATRSPRRAETAVGQVRAGSAAAPAVPVQGARPAAPPSVAGSAAPRVRTEQVAETEAIPFRTTLIKDPSLPPGRREIDQPGVPGERLLRYKVTYTGTRETSRRLLDSTVTREPRDRIVAFGPRAQHSGGQSNGGQSSGGQSSGGPSSGGPSSGGPSSGGPSSGGPSSGGPSSGGPSSEGPSSGGQNSGGQNSGGQNSGGDREPHDGDRDEPLECLLVGTCVRVGRSAVCADGDTAAARPESIVAGDLSLLDLSDLDELELDLPCPDEELEDADAEDAGKEKAAG